MNTRNLRRIAGALVFGAGFGVACGPPDVKEECVPIDEHLGTVVHWCNGIFHPKDDPELTWNGQPAGAGLPVCLPPQSDGSCQVCPLDEVASRVETQMLALLADDEPQCQPEHWELGCMRTEEHGKELGWGPNGSHYCCFEVAVWGPGCDDSQ